MPVPAAPPFAPVAVDSPPPPDGLATAGRAHWVAVAGRFGLHPHELLALAGVCRCADELATLEAVLADQPATVKGSRGQVRAHPILAEIRAHRLLLSRLMSALALPADGGEWEGLTASQRARKAARARWS